MSYVLGQTVTLVNPVSVTIPTFTTTVDDNGVDTKTRIDVEKSISTAVIVLVYGTSDSKKYQVQLLGTVEKVNDLTEDDFS